nr:magnetosome protein Mad2 [Desulfobacteraceae bacterium]
MKVKTATFEIPIFGWGSIKKRAILVAIIIFLGAIYAYTSDYNLATGTGNLSMVLFLAANVYFPAKKIRLHYNIKHVQQFYNKLLVYHIWLNTLAFIVTCIHCYVSLWSNNWLITALFIMGWLTFGGFLMWIKYQPGKVKKGMYILHTQQVLFFIMIFAMLKGHYVI